MDAADRMARLRERRRRDGLQEVLLWVPKDRANKVRQLVRDFLRDEGAPAARLGPVITADSRVKCAVTFARLPSAQTRKAIEDMGLVFDGVAWRGSVTVEQLYDVLSPAVSRHGGQLREEGYEN